MNKTYLGDGLYFSYDGYQCYLTAPRGMGEEHMVALDDQVLSAFFKAVENTFKVKITIEKLQPVAEDE